MEMKPKDTALYSRNMPGSRFVRNIIVLNEVMCRPCTAKCQRVLKGSSVDAINFYFGQSMLLLLSRRGYG